ncbi:nucleotide exchange factor GrpE [Streptomyces sp. CBMA156]|uniref:nucleotide exchange factor GrpE n=1 Tax=Streptomyces sp. CBMA156 TaxID=1930280 RepID=UPI001661A271|nr:nucleotide exchange factor GrpE [Streptomyces sp. CBMA156]MBD0672916.1 nucleotide exchange factor GrpE [Streptomyces sp. CBMA156]
MTDAPTSATPASEVPTSEASISEAATASPLDGHRRLEVPPGVEDVDLEQTFGRLLFRASLLESKLTEQKQSARAEQRELLGILVEVDDALGALGLDRELVALGRGVGIEATRRRLLGQLAKAKVRPMRLEGMTADPGLTEIVGTEARAGVAPETVVRTVVTGFFWGDEVLRRAQVVVAAPESESEPEPELELETGPESEPEAGRAAVVAEADSPLPEPAVTAVPVEPQAVEPETPEAPEKPETPETPEAVEPTATTATAPVTRVQPRTTPPRARRQGKTVAKQARQAKQAKQAKRKK